VCCSEYEWQQVTCHSTDEAARLSFVNRLNDIAKRA
jgi:hypothetical protein